jgi:hypothetical protein
MEQFMPKIVAFFNALPARIPAMEQSLHPHEITLDRKTLDRYAGNYLVGGVLITVTRDDAHLFIQLPRQPKVELFPRSEHDFFVKIDDGTVSFETDAQGRATALVVHNGERHDRVPRLAGNPPPPPPRHKEVAVDAWVFDRWAGRYEIAPGTVLALTREGEHFFIQENSKAKVEIFAEGERDYFIRIGDAQIHIEVDGEGRTTGLVVHQGGGEVRGKRID